MRAMITTATLSRVRLGNLYFNSNIRINFQYMKMLPEIIPINRISI